MATETVSTTELHIGNRVVAARLLLGISREVLASELGVTPEQLQKYEDGESLTSARRLYEIAQALGVEVSYFYEGLNGTTSCPYSLSGERYALLRRAVLRIAADHEVTRSGRRKKLPRHEAINAAREVCLALGWTFSKAGVSEDCQSRPKADSLPSAFDSVAEPTANPHTAHAP